MDAPRVSVIVVSYGHARFLPALFASLERVDYPRGRWQVTLLDNASEDGTAELVRRELIAPDGGWKGGLAGRFVASAANLGFAGGNDLLIREAMEEGYDFVYLLNPDTEVEPDFLARAVEAAASDPKLGAVQSLLLMGQDHGEVNSAGNAFHYLGFSFCVGYRDRADSPECLAIRDRLPEIATASGAGLLLRVAALRETGPFDEIFFAYHDDLELSLKLRLAGWGIALAPRSVVYHHYEFSRSVRKYYWMERNRLLTLLVFLRWRTLLLIFPMLAALECGMFFFAFRSGWWREKSRSYSWFLSPRNLRAAMRLRGEVRRLRKIPDRELAHRMVSEISYQEIDNPLLRRVGNPMMRGYWRLVLPLIRW